MEKEYLDLLASINKHHGAGSVLYGNSIVDVDTIPTGSIGLDVALGTGGYPKGRIVEIYGPESSGKTTLTLHAIAEAQKRGGRCAFIDAEHAFDREYAIKCGVNVDELFISQPNSGEHALDIVEELIASKLISLVIVDSVATLTPQSELDGEMGDSNMGKHARLMSQALRKLTGVVHKTGCCLVFINQLREKIGVVFGPNEVTTGGNALKFYTSVRLDIRRNTQIKDKEGNVVGNRTKVKVVKNKLAPPFKVCEFDIMYGIGVYKIAEVVDTGAELGIVKKAGSWYSYEDIKIGQGREAAIQFLEDNPELTTEIESKIKEKYILDKTQT